MLSNHLLKLLFAAPLTLLPLAVPLLAVQDAAPPDAPIERFRHVDQRLYRGAQPDRKGFEFLHQMGVRTVINLRQKADAVKTDEQRIVEGLGMRYVNIPVEDGNFFTRSRTIPDDAIREFFQTLDTAEPGGVFLHCHRGADRTGAIVGFYRIARQGWDGARAYAEAKEIGMRSWYRGLKRQVESFEQHARAYAPVTTATK